MAKLSYTYKPEFNFDIKLLAVKSGLQINPFSIVKFIKICDYHNDFFPRCSVVLKVSDNDLRNIKKFKNELVCNIKCTVSSLDPTKKEYIYINDSFFVSFDELRVKDIMSPDVKSIDDKIGAEDAINSSYDGVPGGYNKYDIEFNLISLNDIASNKKLFNFIFSDSQVSSAIKFIISNNENIKSAYIDQIENNTYFVNLAVPPLNTRNVLNFIHNQYGIYTDGLVVFMDSGKLYVLKKYNSDHQAFSGKSLLTTIEMNEDFTGANPEQVIKVMDDNSFSHEVFSKADIIDNDVIYGEFIGNNYLTTNLDSILSSLKIENGEIVENNNPITNIIRLEETHLLTGVKNTYDYDAMNNPFEISSKLKDTSNIKAIYIHNIINVDPREFSPERNYFLNISDKDRNRQYGGMKSISQAIFVFNKSLNITDNFKTTCSANIVLK